MAAHLLNKTKFRKQYWARLLSSPWVMAPFAFGITDLLILWTFSLDSGIGIFAGLAGILGAAGMFMTRLLSQSQTISKEIIEKMEHEAVKNRIRALDDLDKRLAADGDPRSENSLRDLRILVNAFRKERDWSTNLNAGSSFDIRSGVEQLFERCVLSLEKSLSLWYTAGKMHTKEAKRPILAQREQMITEVKQSIRKLGAILAEIQSLAANSQAGNSDLARIRKELDTSLEVAKSVNERMRNLDRELE